MMKSRVNTKTNTKSNAIWHQFGRQMLRSRRILLSFRDVNFFVCSVSALFVSPLRIACSHKGFHCALPMTNYRTWTILVFQNHDRWQFSCCPPHGEPIFYPDEYASQKAAHAAAKQFINCMIVRSWVAQLLDKLLEVGLIRHCHHEDLSRIASGLFKLRFAALTERDRKQHALFRKNHRDS